MTTHRIHGLAELRETIKTNATRARELRQEARDTSGLDRHYLKCDANDYGGNTRYPHLASGYLRGRTISEMESESTRPDNLPSAHWILWWSRRAFLEGPDAPEWEREKKVTTPVKDDRGFIAKLTGAPEPVPVTVVDYLDPPGWAEFKAEVEADIKAWHAKCLAGNAMKVATRQAAKKKVVEGVQYPGTRVVQV